METTTLKSPESENQHIALIYLLGKNDFKVGDIVKVRRRMAHGWQSNPDLFTKIFIGRITAKGKHDHYIVQRANGDTHAVMSSEMKAVGDA